MKILTINLSLLCHIEQLLRKQWTTYMSLTPAQRHCPPTPARPSGQLRLNKSHLKGGQEKKDSHTGSNQVQQVVQRTVHIRRSFQAENKSKHFTMPLIHSHRWGWSCYTRKKHIEVEHFAQRHRSIWKGAMRIKLQTLKSDPQLQHRNFKD